MAEATMREHSKDSIFSMAQQFSYHIFDVNFYKVISLVLVTFLSLYHGWIHLSGAYHCCDELLSNGRFVNGDTWQPLGCMMHNYTKSHLETCFQNAEGKSGSETHFVLLGDSRLRNLYHQLVYMISEVKPDLEGKSHSDMEYKNTDLRLDIAFWWEAKVNASMTADVQRLIDLPTRSRPNYLLLGSGTHSIKTSNGSMFSFEEHKANMTKLLPFLEKLRDTTTVIWVLQDPVSEERIHPARAAITNERLDMYNAATQEILKHSSVKIWESTRKVAQMFPDEQTDGLHFMPSFKKRFWDSQILWNHYCNKFVNFGDAGCCAPKEKISILQQITAIFFVACGLAGTFIFYIQRLRDKKTGGSKTETDMENGERETDSKDNDLEELVKVMFAMSKFGIIMFYFFVCDRYDFFQKENKVYSHGAFFLPLLVMLILGLYYHKTSKQVIVLHRDQTNEWKGWMQLIIVIYHITNASTVLPIYMNIRILVSSYLFLNGYGHFFYYWSKGNYSITRVLQVLFRMNFLVVMLCLVMNRPYQFYYFVPLVSFWYLVTYCIMSVWPHLTAKSAEVNSKHFVFMVGKLVLALIVITLLFFAERFFHQMFGVMLIKDLFMTSNGSLHEWRFRWELDRYSTLYGIGFAFALMLGRKSNFIDDTTSSSLFQPKLHIFIHTAAVFGLASHFMFTILCSNKVECNSIHSYISIIPIVSFVILRNSTGRLRVVFSTFFAWFGKFSLELFISQYHIWLAADTKGLLVLIPDHPYMNLLFITFIFVCVAHEISNITGVIAAWAVPNDTWTLRRNTSVFALSLLIIAWMKGTFTV